MGGKVGVETSSEATVDSFKGKELMKRIKDLVEKYPQYKDVFGEVSDNTENKLATLRQELTEQKRQNIFEKIRGLKIYQEMKNRFDSIDNIEERKKIQRKLGFEERLVDGIFGPRMFLLIKNLSNDELHNRGLEMFINDKEIQTIQTLGERTIAQRIKETMEREKAQGYVRNIKQKLGIGEGETLIIEKNNYVIKGTSKRILEGDTNIILAQYYMKISKGKTENLTSLNEKLHLKTVEGDFLDIFPEYGNNKLREGDKFAIENDMGYITIFREDSSTVEILSLDELSGFEENLQKYEQFKKDFGENKTRLLKILGYESQTDFQTFFLKFKTGDLYQYVGGCNDLENIENFDGSNYKPLVAKFKKFGITQSLLEKMNLQAEDRVLFNSEEGTLNIFKKKEGMRREPYSKQRLIKVAFGEGNFPVNTEDFIALICSKESRRDIYSIKELLFTNPEKARSIFLKKRTGKSNSDETDEYTGIIKFYGQENFLKQIVTPFLLFSDKDYIKKVDSNNPNITSTYVNDGGEFRKIDTGKEIIEKILAGEFRSDQGAPLTLKEGDTIKFPVGSKEREEHKKKLNIDRLYTYYQKIGEGERSPEITNIKKRKFAEYMNNHIITSGKFDEAKALFGNFQGEGRNTYIINNNIDQPLRQKLSAYALFGGDASITHLSVQQNGTTTTYKRSDVTKEFVSKNGEKLRLTAPQFAIGSTEDFTLISDCFQTNEDKKITVKINELEKYLGENNGENVAKIKQFIKENKLQEALKSAFTENINGDYKVDFKEKSNCDRHITATELFEEDAEYIGIVEGNEVKAEYRRNKSGYIFLGSEQEEFSKLPLQITNGVTLRVIKPEKLKYTPKSPYSIQSIGHPEKIVNHKSGNSRCTESFQRFAKEELKLYVPSENAFQQLYALFSQSQSEFVLGKGAASKYNKPNSVIGLDEIKEQLEKLRKKGIFAAGLYSDAKGDYYEDSTTSESCTKDAKNARRVYYGHAAAVVLCKTSDGREEYYVFDAFNNPIIDYDKKKNPITKPILLEEYYKKMVDAQRGIGGKVQFRGIAGLNIQIQKK